MEITIMKHQVSTYFKCSFTKKQIAQDQYSTKTYALCLAYSISAKRPPP